MARAADETRARRFFGAIVIASAVVLFITIFGIQSTTGWFDDRVQVTADFRSISGLRPGSPVQLAGVVIGRVTQINFIRATYECVPLTEDVGRHGEGRTDDCDS